MIQQSVDSSGPGLAAGGEVSKGDVLTIIERNEGRQGGLMAILGEIQATCGYLPEAALRIVGEQTGRSLVDIYGVATFYRSFSLEPRGKHLICACLGTACHVRGAPRIAEELERLLGIRAGQTTEDREFSLETVNCLGACALGPIVVVDGHYFCNVKRSALAEIIETARLGLEETAPGGDDTQFPIEVGCPRCNHGLMDSSTMLEEFESVRIIVGYGDRFGPAGFSALYPSSRSVCDLDIPDGALCRFFCPQCHGELVGLSRCGECGAPMALLLVRSGGVVHLCTRRGCHRKRLDLDGVNA
ncbi:MAG TPA: NAD(P)H-dependent oxidoreductase subunit E [Phycisphaerae bacterium]|nr:NAD(P)H-dependent oxidoreductase subunit E [Phycisphaerae bacterium]